MKVNTIAYPVLGDNRQGCATSVSPDFSMIVNSSRCGAQSGQFHIFISGGGVLSIFGINFFRVSKSGFQVSLISFLCATSLRLPLCPRSP